MTTVPGCATPFGLLCLQRKFLIPMSNRVRAFHFSNCTAKSLNRHKFRVRRKTNYLNMICMAGLSVILKMVIVNKIYEKGAK